MFVGNKNKNLWSQHIPSLSVVLLQSDWSLWMSIPEGHLGMGVSKESSLSGRVDWNQISRTTRVNKTHKRRILCDQTFPSIYQSPKSLFVATKISHVHHFFSCYHVCFTTSFWPIANSLFLSFILLTYRLPIARSFFLQSASLVSFPYSNWSLCVYSP